MSFIERDKKRESKNLLILSAACLASSVSVLVVRKLTSSENTLPVTVVSFVGLVLSVCRLAYRIKVSKVE